MRLDNATLEKLAEDAIDESGAIMDAVARESIVSGIIDSYNAQMDRADSLCGSVQGKLKKFTVDEDKITATISDLMIQDVPGLTMMKGRVVVLHGENADFLSQLSPAKTEKEEEPKDDRQPDMFDGLELLPPDEQNMTVGAVLTAMETVKDENRLILVDKGQKCTIAAINADTGTFVIQDGPSLEKDQWKSFAFYLADNPDYQPTPDPENKPQDDDPAPQGTNEAPDDTSSPETAKEAPGAKKGGKGKAKAKGKKKDAPRPFFADAQEGDVIACKEAFDFYKAGRQFEVLAKNLKARELMLQELVDVENNPTDEFQGSGQPFPASFDLVNENFKRAK